MGAALAAEPCYLVQRLDGKTGAVTMERVCGTPDGEVIVVGKAGTSGGQTGVLGATAADVLAVDPTWLPAGRVGHAFRCAPDPDRPGQLNAGSNEECCCPAPKTPACAKVVYSCR